MDTGQEALWLTPPPTSAESSAPSQPPPYLSFSQVSTYQGCGEKYRLRYVERVQGEVSGAALGGSAVHEAIAEAEPHEWWREEEQPHPPMYESFLSSFEREIDEAGGEHQIRWGGRKTRDFPTGENHDWWLFNARVMLKRYAAIRKEDEKRGVFIPPSNVERKVSAFLYVDGKPATEALHVMGFIDALVMVNADGERFLRDWKTGRWADPQQLAVYAWLLANREPKISVTQGQIAKLRSPRKENWLTDYDLTEWIPIIPRLVSETAHGIQSQYFPLRPSNMCPSCSVRKFCEWGSTLEEKEPGDE